MGNVVKFENSKMVVGAVTTMTLKEITDLLEVRHNDAMTKVEKMLENQDFGLATKILYPITSGKRPRTVY